MITSTYIVPRTGRNIVDEVEYGYLRIFAVFSDMRVSVEDGTLPWSERNVSLQRCLSQARVKISFYALPVLCAEPAPTIPYSPESTRRYMQQLDYFENARMILAEMCRKKMEAMKESERTRTMNGSL